MQAINYSLMNKKDHNKKVMFCVAEVITSYFPDLTTEVTKLTSLNDSPDKQGLNGYLDALIKEYKLTFLLEDIFYEFNSFSKQILAPISQEDFMFVVKSKIKEMLYDKYVYQVCLDNEIFSVYLNYLDKQSTSPTLVHCEIIHDVVVNELYNFIKVFEEIFKKEDL